SGRGLKRRRPEARGGDGGLAANARKRVGDNALHRGCWKLPITSEVERLVPKPLVRECFQQRTRVEAEAARGVRPVLHGRTPRPAAVTRLANELPGAGWWSRGIGRRTLPRVRAVLRRHAVRRRQTRNGRRCPDTEGARPA